jgi:predicted phosphoribosyltransferase
MGPLDPESAVVLALPRGGVPVAFEVAQANRCPLALLLVRKIGVPGHRELALGAIVGGEPPITVVNREIAESLGIGGEKIDALAKPELEEIARQAAHFGVSPQLDMGGKTAVVVDDGLATGATARAALEALRRLGARRIILAVPVAPADALEEFEGLADEVVCLARPEPFLAVGGAYEDFEQVDDETVTSLLAQARAQAPTKRG